MMNARSLPGVIASLCVVPFFFTPIQAPAPVSAVAAHAPLVGLSRVAELRALAVAVSAPVSAVFTSHEPVSEQGRCRTALARFRAAAAEARGELERAERPVAVMALAEACARMDRLAVRATAVFENYQLGHIFDSGAQLEAADRSLTDVTQALAQLEQRLADSAPSSPAPPPAPGVPWAAVAACGLVAWLLRRNDALAGEVEALRAAAACRRLAPANSAVLIEA